MDFDLWKSNLEHRLAEHLFHNPEQPYASYKHDFHLNQKLSDYFVKWGFRPQRVEQAFREFYQTAFEDADPMELFNLDEAGINALVEYTENRHPSGLFGLLTAEGWIRAYIGCMTTGRLHKVHA